MRVSARDADVCPPKKGNSMPKFIIYEERVETYCCIIEADSVDHAKKLYDEDPEEVFGDQWEHDETQGVDLRKIVELENGAPKVDRIFEDGVLVDSIARKE